ncbi:MAG: hypothetical protein EOO07_08440 [Chitinophagaceae bacterium]|nr:MAG: hypothetical protein EOO07_08440 [Chitinophagaceae bacterium]
MNALSSNIFNNAAKTVGRLIFSLGITLLVIGIIKLYLHEGWPNYIALGLGLIALRLFASKLASKIN